VSLHFCVFETLISLIPKFTKNELIFRITSICSPQPLLLLKCGRLPALDNNEDCMFKEQFYASAISIPVPQRSHHQWYCRAFFCTPSTVLCAIQDAFEAVKDLTFPDECEPTPPSLMPSMQPLCRTLPHSSCSCRSGIGRRAGKSSALAQPFCCFVSCFSLRCGL
jgi:hypothetical protein